MAVIGSAASLGDRQRDLLSGRAVESCSFGRGASMVASRSLERRPRRSSRPTSVSERLSKSPALPIFWRCPRFLASSLWISSRFRVSRAHGWSRRGGHRAVAETQYYIRATKRRRPEAGDRTQNFLYYQDFIKQGRSAGETGSGWRRHCARARLSRSVG